MRILGIDPGEKRIGTAVSDPGGRFAKPLTILMHTARDADAEKIADLAKTYQVERIVVGQATDMEGKPNLSGRRAARLAAAVRTRTEIPVELWDESFSSQEANRLLVQIGAGKKKRRAPKDDIAAARILQSYLDAKMIDTQG